ncbi:hypothetical protein LHJ74_06640 [Streptomyces sp. N2-109]|uniref:Uncharacterized protein n=1 Tax=Streptomyces gossypii TaxID=2883101 RepID=A0ABT2JNZ4_9ACTN|nr:hypothetical protein [Streptomyces gossypii]MCT2589603.1 hypothetical protein [Streptomyces gossypii]
MTDAVTAPGRQERRAPRPYAPPYAAPLGAVDEVEVTTAPTGFRLRATKTVCAQDPYMAGHFPKLIMLPAVFLLEGLRQAVAVAFPSADPPELLRILSARLLAPMLEGDEITLDAVGEQAAGGHHELRVRCTGRDGRDVATLRVLIGVDQDQDHSQNQDQSRDRLDPPPPPVPAAGDTVLDHARIRELLPVRHPILLVDRVIALSPGEELSSVKSITGSEPCYQGLPEGLPAGRYAYPRSLIFESFGQSAALLWLSSAELATDDGVLMLGALRNCRFNGPVFPGDRLRHVVRLERMIAGNAFVSGEIFSDAGPVATVESLIAVARPRGAVAPAGVPPR